MTLSDPFCVERYRDEFLRMIHSDVDPLVANEHELRSLYLTHDLEVAIGRAWEEVPITTCTAGAHGAHVIAGDAPATVPRGVDATGRVISSRRDSCSA